MPAGLEVYDANAKLVFSVDNRLGRVVAVFNASGYGSRVVPELASGRGWAFGVYIAGQGQFDAGYAVISVVGTKVSWQCSAGETVRVVCGVF